MLVTVFNVVEALFSFLKSIAATMGRIPNTAQGEYAKSIPAVRPIDRMFFDMSKRATIRKQGTIWL